MKRETCYRLLTVNIELDCIEPDIQLSGEKVEGVRYKGGSSQCKSRIQERIKAEALNAWDIRVE